jgi:hypothetical protein
MKDGLMAAEAPQKYLKRVPEVLIYERMNGKPVYYRGYRQVLAGKLTPNDIMGSSGLQSLMLMLLEDFIKMTFKKRFWVLPNELGLHLDVKDNYSADLALYEKKTVSVADIAQRNYLSLPPKVVLEVDIKADIPEPVEHYCATKTQALLDWGIEQVIWFFTDKRKIVTAQHGQGFQTVDWSETIEILDEPFNLKSYAFDYEDIDIDKIIGVGKK